MIAPGTRLGPYEVRSFLESGGMGEIYRAYDPRLGREVAIKILSEAHALDPDLLRRFEREARAAGRLNHPRILTVHDVGTHAGNPYLVCELLEGNTLRQSLMAGPIPDRQAIELAMQIAEGLSAAHAHGIIHRDLKPENVFVTSQSGVKLLDFGLATLALSPGFLHTESDPSRTLTSSGVILGTIGYMAPEQIRGEAVDPRTDIFALGAVMHEMVFGVPAFPGRTGFEAMGATLSAEPSMPSNRRGSLTTDFNSVIRRCLEKDPERRFRTVRDVASALERVGSPESVRRSDLSSRQRTLSMLVLGMIAVLVAVVVVFSPYMRSCSPLRSSFRLPQGLSFGGYANVALSPDGHLLAFSAVDSTGTSRLWIRQLDAQEIRSIAGTEGAFYPFWSPDSRRIGYFARGRLWTVSPDGGAARDIASAPSGRGGTWNRQGDIIFAPSVTGPLMRVRENGTEAAPLTQLNVSRGETGHRWPTFLPDGRHVLFMVLPARGGEFETCIGELNSKVGKHLLVASTAARWVHPGYVLFERQGTLFSQRLHGVDLVGEARPIAATTRTLGALGEPGVSGSETGMLTYMSTDSVRMRLDWVSRDGKDRRRIPLAFNSFVQPRLSPDGKEAAIERTQSSLDSDIWTIQLERGTTRRITFQAGLDRFPQWSPDGRNLFFASDRNGRYDLFKVNAAHPNRDQLMETGLDNLLQWPTDCAREARSIVYETFDPRAGSDLWILPLSAPTQRTPFASSPASETDGHVSPGAQLLAYVSNESGTSEVYVDRFPEGGDRVQASLQGGYQPRWGPEGTLYYLAPNGGVNAVTFESRPALSVATSRMLFLAPLLHSFDVGQGERFLCCSLEEGGSPITLWILADWWRQPRR